MPLEMSAYTVYSMISQPHSAEHRCYGINVLLLILYATFTDCIFPQLMHNGSLEENNILCVDLSVFNQSRTSFIALLVHVSQFNGVLF